MYKIGVLLCAYGNPDYVDNCIAPWLKLKNELNIKIAACHGMFKEVHELGYEDEDRETLEKLINIKEVDYIYIQNNYWTQSEKQFKYSTEAELRDHALQLLLKEKCDIIWLLDLDEFYTEEQIENIVKYIENESFITWFSIPFKNYIFDGKSYTLGFSPPRIFRKNMGDIVYAEIDKFYFDNDIKYKLSGDTFNDQCDYKSLSNKQIPSNIIHKGIKHMTWLHSNGKKKVEYQMRHFGDCSYKWNEEKQELEFNLNFYKKNNLKIPIINKDE